MIMGKTKTEYGIAEGVIYPSIPGSLLNCYRGGEGGGAGPALGAPRRLDVFLSLLRKLEDNSQLDMRLFSAALLRSLRLDGIEQAANPVETEFVTPYRASAFQFHKYKLLMDLFIPGQNVLEVDEILTTHEKCLLHRMMSSTVHRWERGDESTSCPVSVELTQRLMSNNSDRLPSRCPIEEGVIQTKWGTISPGTVVAAIAASLESQRVLVTDILNADVFKAGLAEPIMDATNGEWDVDIETLHTVRQTPGLATADISNLWAATLAGDLAEVAVNQGPLVGSASQKMVVGSNNKWNDTLLPRHNFLLIHNTSTVDWHYTDAEILAGVDGLILAQHVPKWVSQRGSLRLSQVLDMYYSNQGSAFDPSVRACNRQALFSGILDQSVLSAETKNFASVLALSQGTVYMQVDELDRICEAAVAAFVNYFPTVLTQSHRSCPGGGGGAAPRSVVDLVVATDGSWAGYDVHQMLSWIGEELEVGFERGSISLLHGNTGNWIAPPSSNLSALFEHLSNFSDPWPDRLNLPNVMSTVLQYSMNKSLSEAETEATVAPSTVVLIISPSDTPSDTEVDRARDIFLSLRQSYFDVYFAYVARDLTAFENINTEYLDYSELFIKTDRGTVRDTISALGTDLINAAIPKRIIGAHCEVNETVYKQVPYEDFVLPQRENKYRIHSYYMRQQPAVAITVRNNGQGTLLACEWRGAETSRTCKTLDERQTYTFNLTDPCPSQDFCPPSHFSISAVSTQNICANNDCRLPQQVGYYITQDGLRCLALRNKAKSLVVQCVKKYLLFLVLMVTYLI
ncbi:uncharacterized protein LOC105385944 [Plutella xylostella]|uniref:uncharacterized protein LOC105385944 n=1 Tax=Plutella xylostella TaxID=51655 RepID=UPI00203236DB|nr:uncharacterized protein LOC105385944 [Plutella xylostella]